MRATSRSELVERRAPSFRRALDVERGGRIVGAIGLPHAHARSNALVFEGDNGMGGEFSLPATRRAEHERRSLSGGATSVNSPFDQKSARPAGACRHRKCRRRGNRLRFWHAASCRAEPALYMLGAAPRLEHQSRAAPQSCARWECSGFSPPFSFLAIIVSLGFKFFKIVAEPVEPAFPLARGAH